MNGFQENGSVEKDVAGARACGVCQSMRGGVYTSARSIRKTSVWKPKEEESMSMTA